MQIYIPAVTTSKWDMPVYVVEHGEEPRPKGKSRFRESGIIRQGSYLCMKPSQLHSALHPLALTPPHSPYTQIQPSAILLERGHVHAQSVASSSPPSNYHHHHHHWHIPAHGSHASTTQAPPPSCSYHHRLDPYSDNSFSATNSPPPPPPPLDSSQCH